MGHAVPNFLRISSTQIDWVEKTQQGEHMGELVEIQRAIEK